MYGSRLAALLLAPCLLQEPAAAYVAHTGALLPLAASLSSRYSPTQTLAGRAVQGWRTFAFRDHAPTAAFLSLFAAASAVDYHFLHEAAERNPLYERLSFVVLTFFGALSGGLTAQWLRLKTGKQDHWELKPLLFLLALNIFYSTFVEVRVYGHWLEEIPLSNGARLALDLGLISLFFSDPAAFLVYGKYLHPREESHAREEIRDKLLGFYIKYGGFWGIALGLSLYYEKNPIISFTFIQAGILLWNVAFEYEKYPDSKMVLDWAHRHPRTRWVLYPVLKGIHVVHSHSSYIEMLKNLVFFVYAADLSSLASDFGFSAFTQTIIFGSFLISRVLWLLHAHWPAWIPRVLWTIPFLMAPALAAHAIGKFPVIAISPPSKEVKAAA